MCGISVLVHRHGGPISPALVEAMNGRISHRGPDDSGTYFADGLAFGHQRLSIIDLSPGGHQPMTWQDRLTITYNGEVYNYLELRAELERAGYTFATTSDTEVLLASYAHWGERCVERFIGMWAFAIHDVRRGVVFCSRDRFGVKPFVYGRVGEYFAAASEAKQIAALPGFRPRLDRTAAFRFLARCELNVDERTFFDGITELRGGHSLTYDLRDHTLDVRCWYDPSTVRVDETFGWEEAQRRFRDLLLDAVRLRLRSDVEVGACLSGGLDSSAIVVAAKSVGGTDLRLLTLSCCWDDPRYDETEYVRAVTAATGFPGVLVYPKTDDLLDVGVLDSIVWHQDQPILGASHFAEYKIFEAAKAAHLKVMLDGQGGDECLAGYPEYLIAFVEGRFLAGQPLAGIREVVRRGALRDQNAIAALRGFSRTLLLPLASQAKRRLLGRAPGPSWLAPAFVRGFAETDAGANAGATSIAELSKQQILRTSIPYQLHSEDRNSMMHSIESRLPFLDYRLVELLLRLPDQFKLRNGETKAILRHAFADLLPASIRNRHTKLGFAAPEEPWMRENAARLRVDLARTASDWPDLFTTDLLRNFDDWVGGRRAYDPALFRALTFGRWADQFGAAC